MTDTQPGPMELMVDDIRNGVAAEKCYERARQQDAKMAALVAALEEWRDLWNSSNEPISGIDPAMLKRTDAALAATGKAVTG